MKQNVVLIPYLEQQMDRITVRFREDFELVRRRIEDAARFPEVEPVEFYWLAWPNGTRLVPEREVYFRDSFAYQDWTHWADWADIAACRIVVRGSREGQIIGAVQPLNYPRQVRRIMEVAIPAVTVEILFYSGETIKVTPEFLQHSLEQIFWHSGAARRIYHHPEDEMELARIMAEEHRRQTEEEKTSPAWGETGGNDVPIERYGHPV